MSINPKAIFPDGSPVPDGWCIMPDHYATTFMVTVRSQAPLSINGLKDLIQTKHEVTECFEVGSKVVVQNRK